MRESGTVSAEIGNPVWSNLIKYYTKKPIIFVLNKQGKAHLKKLGELILLLV